MDVRKDGEEEKGEGKVNMRYMKIKEIGKERKAKERERERQKNGVHGLNEK